MKGVKLMSTKKPIYVFEGGGINPHVIATIDTDKFSDHDSKAETAVISRKVNNISTIELTIPTNCEASSTITNTSDLVLFDTKGNIQEFHITDIDDLDEYSVTRTIYAEQSFGELINNIVTSETSMPTTTNPADYLAYILYYTRWSVGTVESGIYNSRWEEDITGLTCLEAFQKLVDKYNCEFEIRYETDGKNKITGRYVDLKKKIGHNYGKRFEDSKDIIGLKRTLDLDSVKTAIYPRIKLDSQDENGNSKTTYVDISSVAWSVAKGDPVDKPIGQTIIVNPEADALHKRYNTKTGTLMEKIMYAEWTGDTAKDAEDLCRQAWSILKANGVLTPTIEVTAGDLYRMSGNDPEYSHEQVDLGDTCIIIDKNFDPELRLTTRVMEIEEDILNPVNNTYVFGNYRKTLATSNIESQKSIEEQLGQLQDKIQGITIPEYSLPYQSGKDYYNDVKAQIQNEFMSASGYVMAQDSDGFWVFDAPIPDDRVATYPTKATILKGGCMALAKYNPVTSTWEVGTFINGTTVNADYITAGHLNANVIAAGSITANHLSTAAVEYIKTGMATDDDLQGVIDSVAKDYATKDSVSSNINNAVKDLVSTSTMNGAISDATKDMATNSSVSSAITNATKDMATNSSVNSAISSATNGLASKDYVNGAVNNITLGGRNIAIKTNQGTTGWEWSMKTGGESKESIVEDGINCCKFTRDNVAQTGWSVITYAYINRNMYRTNTKYTVSFEVKSSVTSGNISCSLRLGNASDEITNTMSMGSIPTADTWTKLSCTLTTVNEFPADTGQILYLSNFNSTTGAVYIFRNLKIEEGTKPSAWSPAPEDMEEQNRLTRINAIKDLQKQLQTEYNETHNKANTIYVDKYLAAGSTEKVTLNSKMTAYTTAYNNYNNFITTMIEDSTITDSEYTSYTTYADAYSTALSELATAMEKANSARLANVYAQARQGLVTTAELEVNNKSVIASAKAGMVSTGDMTSAIDFATKDLVSNSALDSAINNISVGGRNLFLRSNIDQYGLGYWMNNGEGAVGVVEGTYIDGTKTIKVTGQNGIQWNGYIKLKRNTTYVYSMMMKSSGDMTVTNTNPLHMWLSDVESGGGHAESIISTSGEIKADKWTKVWVVFSTPDAHDVYYMRPFVYGIGDNTVYICRVQIEEGNKPTDWTPAPEDVTSYTDDAVGNIKIGGTNLLKQTKTLTGKTGDVRWTVTSTGTEGFNKLYVNTDSTEWVECQIHLYSEINSLTSPVTVSFEYMESIANLLLVSIEVINSSGKRLKEIANVTVTQSFTLLGTRSGWNYVSYTFDPTPLNGQTGATKYRLEFKKPSGKTGAIHVRKPKLEIGNKPSEWTPAPEDVTAYTDAAVSDKVSTTTMNSAINNATKDMATNSSVNTAVSNATKDMATNTGVSNAVNSITVGSRNLALLTSDEWVSFTGFTGATNDCRLSYKVLTSGLSNADKLLVAYDYKLENMTYSSSGTPVIRFQGSGDVTNWNSGQFPTYGIEGLDKKPTSAEGTVYGIANVYWAQLDNSCWHCNFRTDYITGGTISIRRIRVVRTSKIVDWTAAPEDAYTNAVAETFRAITTEYNNNYKIATTLYSDSYLGGTAKTNLKTAYDDYATKYNAVKSAHDDILNTKYAAGNRKETWATALTNLQTSTITLAQRVQEASTFINTAVYNASKNYTDTAIPDALTGYAKTSYVDSAKADAIADAKKGMVSTSQLEVNNTEILLKTASMGQYNLLRNSDFRSGTDYWVKYDGSVAPNAWGIVNDSDGVVIAGERCMRTWISSSSSANAVWSGFYQDVTLSANTSYTLSYWLASVNSSSRVSVWKGTANDTTLAYKVYSSPIGGGHNRESWKYDSITFTTSTAGTYRMFFQTYLSPASGGYGLFLIKPMLCTGINAQAWTAHPDEIHVGVVSVTEQNGIKVEHSDFSTYTTINAAGLKVYNKKDNSMIASFGESGSAYIGNLTCDGYVNAPQLMPMSKRVSSSDIKSINCSETGKGDFSGDIVNPAMGWAGAMRIVLDYLGIDYTHTDGRFIIDSKSNLVFRIYIKGTTFSNDIELYNVYGNAAFQIYIDAGCKFTGQMRFYNVESDIFINGNTNAVLQRGSSTDPAIMCYNVKSLTLNNIYINYTKADDYAYPIYLHNTNASFSNIDFCNCACMASISDCYLTASTCCGSMKMYTENGTRSFFQFGWSGTKAPAVTDSSPYRKAYNLSSGSVVPTASSQSGAESVTINVTKTFNANTYASYGKVITRYNALIQSAPTQAEADKYGWYVGRVYFSDTKELSAYIAKVTNPVIQVFLQRSHSINASTDYVDVYIDGTDVGQLGNEASKWFTLPSATVTALKDGTRNYIQLNATGTTNYTEYKMNAVLKITGTQTV